MGSTKTTITLPAGTSATVTSTGITIKGAKGEVTRNTTSKRVSITLEKNAILLSPRAKETRREKDIINTLRAHINNIIKGVQEPYNYKLKICSSHFPMQVSVKGNTLEVANFIGEKKSRKLLLKQGATVKVEGEVITVTSADKELAGQVAADIEKLTKRPAFDRRVFMDGIYLTEKAGEPV